MSFDWPVCEGGSERRADREGIFSLDGGGAR